jgi:hypothetical protein
VHHFIFGFHEAVGQYPHRLQRQGIRSRGDGRRHIPKLDDYEVHIPPGGLTDALVETTISWDNGLKTRAVSSDQVLAAIKATERMINLTLKGLGTPRGSSAEVEVPVEAIHT